MTTVFIIIVVLACIILGFIILVQNPRGGGLAGNIAGFSNQFMGVKQTTDVLEKGTWIFAGIVALLSLVSVFFIPKTASMEEDRTKDARQAPIPVNTQPQVPVNAVPIMPSTGQPSNNNGQ